MNPTTNPTLLRLRTALAVKDRRARFGENHTATFAAYGRAHVAWNGRIRPPRITTTYIGEPGQRTLTGAYTTAQLRAYGHGAQDNRHVRKRALRRFAAYTARPIDSLLDEAMARAGARRVQEGRAA